MKTIYIYPTPENVNKVLFKDKADNCFTFLPKEIKCPINTASIKTIPVQV